MAATAVLRYATPPLCHCACRLNSGVRPTESRVFCSFDFGVSKVGQCPRLAQIGFGDIRTPPTTVLFWYARCSAWLRTHSLRAVRVAVRVQVALLRVRARGCSHFATQCGAHCQVSDFTFGLTALRLRLQKLGHQRPQPQALKTASPAAPRLARSPLRL